MNLIKSVFFLITRLISDRLPLALCLSEPEILEKLPWITTEFQEIHASSHRFYLRKHAGSSRKGLQLLETSASSLESNANLEELVASTNWAGGLKALIISGRNTTLLLQLVRAVFHPPKNDRHYVGYSSFIFITWPNILRGGNGEGMSEDEFVKEVKGQNLSLPLDSDVFIIREDERHVLTLWETYSIKRVEILQKIDTNVSKPYILQDLIRFKWSRRRNFHGVPIIATAVHDLIYQEEVKMLRYSNGTVELDSGMAVSMYRMFRDDLNFTERAIRGEYIGEQITAPNILGMETYLERGDADIAIAESGVNENNAAAVNLLHATTSLWLEARFALEPKSRWQFFLIPFHTHVWYLVVLCLIAMVACITVYRKVLRNDEGRINPQSRGSMWTFIQLDILWALGSLCQQGWYDFPHKTPIRILFLVASVTGFLLNAAYSATIISQLSLKELSFPFEKLVNQSYIFYMESDLNFPVDPDKYTKRIQITTVSNLSDSMPAVENLAKIKSAIISFPEFFHAVVQHAGFTDAEACGRFAIIRVSKTPQLCAMAVKKHSPLKEILNVRIAFMYERGIVFRLLRAYKKNTQFSCQDNRSVNSQSLEELFLAFLIIVVGIVLSALFLLLEMLFYRPRRTQ